MRTQAPTLFLNETLNSPTVLLQQQDLQRQHASQLCVLPNLHFCARVVAQREPPAQTGLLGAHPALDPYIDAVQVKSRPGGAGGQRGVRVKAAVATAERLEPLTSYYAKTVHVEKSHAADEHWDHSTDSDSDDIDDDDDDDKGRHYAKKKGARKAKRKRKKHYKPKRKKAYLRVAKQHKHNKKHYDEHDDDHHHHNYDDDNHHHKAKVVHLSVARDKHYGAAKRLSLAGLLGHTLICVNYLLLLRQPTYDGHYYTKYAPHGGRGEPVSLKRPGGPLIVAHCSQLGPQTELAKFESRPQVAVANKTEAVQVERTHLVGNSSDLTQANHLVPLTGANATAYKLPNLVSAEQNNQANVIYLENGARFRQAQQFGDSTGATGSIGGGSLLAPISQVFARLLTFGGGGDGISFQEDSRGETATADAPPRLLRQQVGGGLPLANLRPQQPRRVFLIGSGSPQVVQTRDNLVDLRAPQLEIRLRVLEGRRFGGSAGGGVLGPSALALTSRPAEDARARDDTRARLVDLPEFALSGDSIELTCNHQIPTGRLYSVRWFKDSLEFYRFVPAEAPSAKSALFLPAVQLDLVRSNARQLLLRNVTHRTSGVFRCEVVTEAPQFELSSGERRLQVYSLPENGPRLGLSASEGGVTGAAGPERENSAILQNLNAANNDNDDDEADEGAEPLLARQRAAARLQARQQLFGPLVRCESDRASPAPQLRLFLNSRQVEVSRLLENSTATFSDGLETNFVSFRLALADFADPQPDGKLERAAANRKQGQNLASSNTTLGTTVSTTTTTTSTTARPKAELRTKSGDSKKANALIKFDDEVGNEAEKPAPPKKRKGHKSAKKKPTGSGDRDKAGGRPLRLAANEDDSLAEASGILAAAADGNNRTVETRDNLAGNEQRRKLVTSVVVSPQRVGAERENQQDDGAQPQRPRQQQQRVSYSNQVRIRCVSHLPNLGYEMVSELSVPLTLLVPASQLVGGALAASRRQADEETGGGNGADSRSGSLQSPRTVSVDRLAQASRPLKSFVLYQKSGNANGAKTSASSGALRAAPPRNFYLVVLAALSLVVVKFSRVY